MLLELHLIQNFAPSNLNRDDTGSPKSCEFGGYRRARISSQCIKRAIRKEPSFSEAVSGIGAVRTRRLVDELSKRLSSDGGSEIRKAVVTIFEKGGLAPASTSKDEPNSKILVYMREDSIDRMVTTIRSHLKELTSPEDEDQRELLRLLGEELVQSARCPDIALFGRMLEVGDKTPFGQMNLRADAAAQVAHAISTHQVTAEFDYYTAVDDMLDDTNETGAGMIGTVEFNSACYYRYANIDLGQLAENLGNDKELALATVRAFLVASRDAVPTGKQNSFAARNAPSFFFSVIRESGAWSLANAFLKPIRAWGDTSLTDASIAAVDAHWGDLTRLYGEPPAASLAVCALGEAPLVNLAPVRTDTFATFAEKTLSAARNALGA